MNPAKLGKMANEIAAFFDPAPTGRAGDLSEQAVAMDGFVGHLQRFWDPRMRRELIAWVDGGGGEELSALVKQAITERRSDIAPR